MGAGDDRSTRDVLPPDFGDAAAEYRAARETAAVFDLTGRTQIELTGRDRVRLLHNLCTNDIKKLACGQGCEAFVTNVKGRVLAHIFVFASENSLWIDSGPGGEAALLAHLDRYLITEDVQLRGRTEELGELLVSGAAAAEVLTAAGLAVDRLERCGHADLMRGESRVSVRRVDLLGSPGYLASLPRADVSALRSALVAAGCTPAGGGAFEALRIEAGLPTYGLDVGEDQIAQEVARTRRAISFTKGCYLGQEPIARLDALGHVNRELRGLRLTAAEAPPQGSPVIAADDGKEIGSVTSSAALPDGSGSVALAYLRSRCVAPGTRVMVQCQGGQLPAEVFWSVD